MPPIQCFMIEPIGRAKRALRVYVNFDLPEHQRKCPTDPHGYHQLFTWIEDGDVQLTPEGYIAHVDWPKDDPRWPKHCPCGYQFRPEDNHQFWQQPIYRAVDGRECTLRDAPPGAMWYADWFHLKGPDGRTLTVQTPAGEWCIDGYATGGGRPWTRTGTPPLVTVTPSINFVGRYHGWLKDGVLTEC
jgi:hypothetical protein